MSRTATRGRALTPSMESYACLRAAGTSPAESYRASYRTTGNYMTVAVEASRLEAKPAVAARIAELRNAHAASVIGYTVASAMTELDLAMDVARATKNAAALAKIVEVRMRLYGLGVADQKNPADKEEMPPEELEAALQQLKAMREARNAAKH